MAETQQAQPEVGGEHLRAQIVQAALELFREKGYHSATMQDIITAANCSKGGFYHHFASKEDLLYFIHDAFITYELERGEAARRMPGSSSDRLRQVIVDLIESIERFRPHVTVFFEERRFLSQEKFAQIKEKRDRYQALVQEIITEGMRSGEFRRDVDPLIATLGVFGMCNWTYQWFRPQGGLSAQEVADMFVQMILTGLRSGEGGGRRATRSARQRRPARRPR